MAKSKRNTKEFQAYNEWQELCTSIKNATVNSVMDESEIDKASRKKALSQNFVKFCKYYFPHYLDSDFAWFHKKAAKEIESDINVFIVLEWAREHAKSVFADIMIPMYLHARGELTGMVVVSANADKANTLLGDIQAEFVANQAWINDYGEMASFGDWSEGKFSTTDGTGFWAFGRGQSPRGIRKASKRPNYAVVDDIDDKVIVRNQERVKNTVDWILEDLYGALSIKGARIVFAGNRIHKQAILAHIVGDVEVGDPKREGIVHIKVYAIEHPKTHNKSNPKHGVPAWKERYTMEQLVTKMTKMGFRAARREYFHEHHEEGHVFKEEWFHWIRPLADTKYNQIIVYCDPSFKETKKNDYKAIIVIGKTGKHIDVLFCWVRQTSVTAMVKVFYDLYERFGQKARYYMEANFLQDLLLDEFTEEGEKQGHQLPIRGDKRSKPNKYDRIENISPLFERGFIRFNERERKNPDFQTFKDQLLGFPYGHDDAPDALEGGIYYIQRISRSSGRQQRMGRFTKRSKRD